MTQSTGAGSTLADAAKREADAYRGDNPRPLGGYVVVLLVYGGLVAAVTVAAAATGRRLPPGWSAADLLTVTLGTHKLSRTLAKDAVTSPLRAPFTEYTGTGGPAEVMEQTRHSSGWRHSLGELLTCPFCLDMWVARAMAHASTSATVRCCAGRPPDASRPCNAGKSAAGSKFAG
ncbi:DUF1360 domain-containing protein [Mycobacterium sp. UM_Kg27]|uniref:DUF1360 domain-containing protein n=1 Tax=Mycobacterium sp. UM_Kg27 TaxID=1545693 RepID=UPI0009E341FF|nr:DUF1360 domain-containing protein [Mycobacterium sp. UM_Kg27]